MASLLNKKYVGLQALACGLIGVLISTILERYGVNRMSTQAGVFCSVSIMLVVLGSSHWRSARLWILVLMITTINLALVLVTYPKGEFKPLILAPFLLVEIVAYLYAIDRLG